DQRAGIGTQRVDKRHADRGEQGPRRRAGEDKQGNHGVTRVRRQCADQCGRSSGHAEDPKQQTRGGQNAQRFVTPHARSPSLSLMNFVESDPIYPLITMSAASGGVTPSEAWFLATPLG